MYHHLRYLAESHDVHLLSFIDRSEDAQWMDALGRHCRQVEFVRLDPRLGVVRGVLAMARGRSLSEGYFGGRHMLRAVRRAVAGVTFDVAWASSSAMGQYLEMVPARRRIVDFVDLDSEKWLEYAADPRTPFRWAYTLESQRLRRLETRIATNASCVAFISTEEATLFQRLASLPANIRVIPNGVDTVFFQPGENPKSTTAPQILFTGTLDYRPNSEAVLFFAREVLPLVRREVPAAHFTAVGHRPSRRLRRQVRALGAAITVAGSVPDIRPYFAGAHVCVAPLRIGHGVQNKILEAMAAGVPVVASPSAAAGLAVQDGVHVLLAETSAQFASAVVTLLRQPDRALDMAVKARQHVQRAYRWDVNLHSIDACLNECESSIAPLAQDVIGPGAQA